MNYLHQPRNEHERRKLLNAALPADSPVREFIAPTDDRDCQVRFPFGKYQGRTLGEILEADPAYLRWLTTEAALQEGPFTEALFRVAAKFQDRINTAQRIRRARRF